MHAMIFARRLRILSTLLACFGLLVVGTGCGSPIAPVASSPTPSFTASALPTHLASPPSSLSPTPLPPTPTFVPGSYMGAGPDKPTTVSASPHETSVPTMAPEGASYASEQGYFTVTFDRPWKSAQSNALTVTVHEIDEPLILAVELLPIFNRDRVRTKPLFVGGGTPVAGNLEEVSGYLIIHQVNLDNTHARISFPEHQLDPVQYEHSDIVVQGFVLRCFLVSQIDTYPVSITEPSFHRFTIMPSDVLVQPMKIVSESEERDIASSNSIRLPFIVPNADQGVFIYLPFDAIIDTIILTSDLRLAFTEKGVK